MKKQFKIFFVLFFFILFSSTAFALSEINAKKNSNKIMTELDLNSIEPIIDEPIKPIPYAYFDYNQDGIIDLVRKEINGNYYVYFNQGTNEEKIFRKGTLVEEKKISELNIEFIKPEIESNENADKALEWQYLSFPRFDLYIEQGYYNNNTASLTAFFNKFADRYDTLEAQTKWSVEKFYPNWPYKLRLNVYGNPGICGSGVAVPGIGNMTLGNPFPNPGCQWPYYVNGTPYLGNPGELGDDWLHMTTPIHEALHAINPLAIYLRPWLTDGFSQYNQYNILVAHGDVNQETVDYYIHRGTWTWNWTGYVANDYRDRLNKSIQQSLAYDLSAWMFSMMRNNHSLDWNSFYDIMDNNYETLNKSYAMRSQSVYFTDMHIIDLFARGSKLGTFENGKAVWKYYGPSGPGWGVKNWTHLEWYADLIPEINLSKNSTSIGEQFTITTRISNKGNVSLLNVPVKIYANDCNPIQTQIINVSNQSVVSIITNYTGTDSEILKIYAIVNDDNVKIEKNNSNNIASANVEIGCYTYFDKDKWELIDTCDARYQSIVSCPNMDMR